MGKSLGSLETPAFDRIVLGNQHATTMNNSSQKILAPSYSSKRNFEIPTILK